MVVAVSSATDPTLESVMCAEGSSSPSGLPDDGPLSDASVMSLRGVSKESSADRADTSGLRRLVDCSSRASEMEVRVCGVMADPEGLYRCTGLTLRFGRAGSGVWTRTERSST